MRLTPKNRPPAPTARPRRVTRFTLLALTLALQVGTAAAQLVDNPDWKEVEVPPPPAFEARRVLPIDMPPYMNLKFGVDPATLTVTGDGVVRYVVVATSASGTVNAFYEGIRCATDEVKTYARHTGGAWQPVETPEWKRFSSLNSRYVQELAKQGLCRGHAPRASVRDMIRELKEPDLRSRF